jgi:hypothetical protein
MSSFLNMVKKTKGSSSEIQSLVDHLISDENWIEVTSKKDIQKIATFLCQINHMGGLKKLLLKCISQIDKIPGDALFYFITKNSDINIAKNIFEPLDQEYSFYKTYLCPFSLAKESHAEQIAKQYDLYYQKYSKTKEALIDKLQFARTQRLEVEVKKTLEKLIEAFPEDPSFVEEKGKYFEKEAARVIDKNIKAYSNKNKFNQQEENYTPLFNGEEIYNIIKNEFGEEQESYLLEIFLMSGEDEVAIKILNQNENLRKQYIWNYIELLINQKRFLESLAQIKEMTTLRNAEDEFNYYYFTAICLWALNDKQTALETMRSIAKIKPHFKQTQLYLNLWQHYDEVA